jgi:DNA-directed RNA polymerase subunit M/transcription elongation factor TFIIS
MPASVPALLLAQNGEVKSIKVTIQAEASGCQIADLQKYFKRKVAPQSLGTYPWKAQTLHLIGYKEGKAGTENQHELPPPCDKDLYFGDIVMLLSKDKKSFAHPVPMKTEEYETFYTQMFEGFESLDESDSEEEGEYDEEDEQDDAGPDEGEFEENEEQDDFSDDNDDQETLEEFDSGKKEKEEEEEPVPVQKRKTSAKATKGKAKSGRDSTILHLVGAGVELQPEAQVGATHPLPAPRASTLQAIQRLLGNFLRPDQFAELEHHLYNMSLQVATRKHITRTWAQPLFTEVYLALARSVIGNLNPSSYIQNKNLYSRFREGKVTLEELVTFSFSDLYPEIWKDLSIRQFEREKRQLEGNKSMATDQFECKRCHKRECTYYELQTRSADEPMTIFIQCVNCGKHWRQ